jgi:hypothetical protein
MEDSKDSDFCYVKVQPGQRWFRPMHVDMSFLLMGYDEAISLKEAL